MEIEFRDGAAVLAGAGCFEPRHIFDNGQAFRFQRAADGVYEGVAHGRFLRVLKAGDTVTLYPSNECDYNEIWRHYFDLDTDYDSLFAGCKDEALRLGRQYGCGLRLLNQQPFETLISFIVSANNNVGRIRGILDRICRTCGQPFVFEGQTYYCFPKPQALAALSEDALRQCGSGYRAPYIVSAAQMVADGFDLEEVRGMEYRAAKKRLMQLPGVGPKVADCVLLFSLGHRDAFPADVWIKRVMKQHYHMEGNDAEIYEYARRKFGEQAGIAQQYLFFWQRENARKDKK